MGGFIVLTDGRAYAVANWAFRGTVESIAGSLAETSDGKPLAEWLRTDPSVQVYYNVDVRELTPANRELFLAVAEGAWEAALARGPGGWSDTRYWEGWLDGLANLSKMIGCVRRGEPPHELHPNMRGVIPPTGDQSGPGW